MKKSEQQIIKFYGGENPEFFEIERRCIDRDGKVINYLDDKLPENGKILDIGAGNGFTAARLNKDNRQVIAMEPDDKMIDHKKDLVWAKGVAQDIPFHSQTFEAAYSTWAFFFPSFGEERTRQGLLELDRVVKKGGPVFIVDNAGDDEFSSLTERDIGSVKADLGFWKSMNFEATLLESHFKFDSIEEAQKLLGFYFGKKGYQVRKTEVAFKIVVYEGRSKGNIN